MKPDSDRRTGEPILFEVERGSVSQRDVAAPAIRAIKEGKRRDTLGSALEKRAR
jgi:hypothetical protein